MTIKLKLLGAVALVGAFAATPASAEWANSLGMGQKTSNIGGAGVASASDYDVFYTNPAGAANITRPTIGVGVRVLSTKGLENSEPGFNHDVSETVKGSDWGYLPSVGAYMPGLLPNVVLGVGFGSPFALAGNWSNGSGFTTGAEGRSGFNGEGFDQVEVLTAELSPTVGIKLSDKLNVGVSVNFTTLKHVFLAIDLNGGLVAPGISTRLTAQTPDDLGLPIPPWEFATSPHEATFTVGAQYQMLPNVAIGAVYREETPTEYDLNLRLHLTGERNTATAKIEIPRHLQVGVSVDVTPALKLSADVKWTNWANAVGVGSPLVVNIGPGGLLGGAAQRLIANHAADDTYSFHLGGQYKVLPNLELQAGYTYDPEVFDTPNKSFLAYSSNRHIFSAGATLELADAALLGTNGDWEFTLGGQFVHYEDFDVAAGQSSTFGLTGSGAIAANPATLPTVNFTQNTSSFSGGGYVWTAGLSAVYKFGAPEELALK